MADTVVTIAIFVPLLLALSILGRTVCTKAHLSSCTTLFVFGWILARTMLLRVNNYEDGVPLLKHAENKWLVSLLSSSLVFNLSYLVLFCTIIWLIFDTIKDEYATRHN